MAASNSRFYYVALVAGGRSRICGGGQTCISVERASFWSIEACADNLLYFKPGNTTLPVSVLASASFPAIWIPCLKYSIGRFEDIKACAFITIVSILDRQEHASDWWHFMKCIWASSAYWWTRASRAEIIVVTLAAYTTLEEARGLIATLTAG